MNASLKFWTKAFDYKSTVNRLSFLWIIVLNFLSMFCLTIYEKFVLNDPGDGRLKTGFMVLYLFATFIPWLAFCARRLNSMRLPRTYILLQAVPLINVIMDLVLILWPERDAPERHLEASTRATE